VTALVIGAGVIGAAIAEALASRGVEVTVIDMRSPGRGATQASAGLLTPFIEGRVDRTLLGLCTRSLALWNDFVARIGERSDVDVLYARDGTLEVAFSESEAASLAEMHAWIASHGVESQWIESGPLARFEPAVGGGARAGLFVPSQGFVAAPHIVKALVDAARQQGAVFETAVEAVRVEPARDRVDVAVEARTISADFVVVAAGCWSGRVKIADTPAVEVRPMRGQLLHLHLEDLPRRPVWGARVYTVPWQPDTLLVGATLEDVGFDERSTVAGVRELLDAVSELLPATQQASLAEIRVGLRPATADLLPIIGPLAAAPRVVMATGHYRNGIMLAPLTADLVCRFIVDDERDPAFDVTSPDRGR
jgi:glycine oxidase